MTIEQSSARATLYRKIAEVAGAASGVTKDAVNPQLKYRYASPATVMEHIKPLLAARQLAIVPNVVNVIKDDTGGKTNNGSAKVLTRVEMTFLILDGETGESLAVQWVGEGEDWSDKGIAKAQTIALRTFLLNVFQIPSVDEETDPDARQAQPPQQREQSRQHAPQNGKAPAKKSEAEQLFWTRYTPIVGGSTWKHVQEFVGWSITDPWRPGSDDDWAWAGDTVLAARTQAEPAKEDAL